MIVNAASLAALETSLKGEFNKGQASVQAQWSKVATEVKSTRSGNTYAWAKGWPKLREWIGDRVIHRLLKQGYTILNRDFEGTVAVDRNHIEDDELGIYAPMSQQLGQSAEEWPDELVYSLLPAGFTSECYDGQNFFDAEHPVGEEQVSNVQAGAGEPWYLLDTKRALKPLIWQPRKKPQFVAQDDQKADNVFMRKEYVYGVDARGNAGYAFWQQAFGSKAPLTAANYEAAVTAMKSQRNDEDRPLNVKPNIIVVGPGNVAAAKKLFKAMLVNGGDSNTLYEDVEIVESQWAVG